MHAKLSRPDQTRPDQTKILTKYCQNIQSVPAARTSPPESLVLQSTQEEAGGINNSI